jgi:peptide deformylase
LAVKEIVTLPAPILRSRARKVSSFNEELGTLVDDMIETMRVAPGVGLAAPQVDVPLRVIVVEFGDEENPDVQPKLYTVINPELSRFSKEVTVGTEGCLSIPGFVGDVERPKSVSVKGFNRAGQPIKVKAAGWLARIFQHEVDHLDGVLYIDRAEKIWELKEEVSQVSPAEQ